VAFVDKSQPPALAASQVDLGCNRVDHGPIWSPFQNLRTPDETLRLPGISEDLVDLGDLTVGRSVQEPDWRWSTHMRPIVGGDWCKARQVGVVLSGRLGAELKDGTVLDIGPDDVYDIPPEHDGYTTGDQPCVLLEWSGLRAFLGFRAESHGRILITLLFTDVVESTVIASQRGTVPGESSFQTL
jgi:hypothetical protein